MTLVASLERPLPGVLPAGRASAIFCVGSCFHPSRRIERLELEVDGVAHRAAAFGMPRPDVAAATGTPHAYHSGFWATVPVKGAQGGASVTLELVAALAGGGRERTPLGEIAVLAQDPPPSLEVAPAAAAPGGGLIAICMATFDPDPALFQMQLDSLRSQRDQNWICVISDDCSSEERFRQIVGAIGDDRRFAVSRSEQRLGFYRNFERALRLVPAEAELVALCDQDDRWQADKLSVLRGAIGGAILVYSDLRLVQADGSVLRDTLWRGRANNHDNLASMLIANTITGAAMLFRRELLDVALPFPDTPGFQFHDHWLAVAALGAGDVAYVDRPLYDYTQHSGAVFGDVTHGSRAARQPSSWRAGYFYGYLAREAQAQALLARCPERLGARKRRALEWFIAADHSLVALSWLIARAGRLAFGRTETLGTELELAQGIAWKRTIGLVGQRLRLRRGPLADASVPPPQEFTQRRLRRWRAQVMR